MANVDGGSSQYDEGHHGRRHPDHNPEPDSREYLELETEVLASYWATVLEWLVQAADNVQLRRIVDLGAGPGLAALTLAKRFGQAEVIALDVAADALAAIRTKAGKALVADRVITIEADLDAVWPDLAELDLTWASMSLHHLAEPDRVLHRLHTATRPGGLFAVAEAGADLRVLPDDLGVGSSGLEARCLDAQAAEHTRTLPTLGTDWAARLRDAGFGVLEERTFVLDEDPPVLPATARYAQLRLERFRFALAESLSKDDQDALACLLDEDAPQFVGRRSDFAVRGSRAVTLARRP